MLLTNGRGGMARLAVDLGRIQSKYDCLLGANLHPEFPVDRHIFAKRARIWVNAVVPSIIDTPANRKGMPQADHDAWPKVDQIARTIEFLASPANHVTRGALVPVYGLS